jgi:hypothetical protein
MVGIVTPFADKEMEAQRGKVTFCRSHTQAETGQGVTCVSKVLVLPYWTVVAL